MYKNYVFDLYGTLLDIRTNENKPYLWRKISELYSAYGASYTPGECRKTFRELEKQLTDALPENGEPQLIKVFEELFSRKGVSSEKGAVQSMAMIFRTLSRSRLCVYDGVHETLQELKRRGKGIYLLSNAQTEFTRPEIRMMDLEKYFDGILISSEEGWKKPAPRFFCRLFERYDLNPEECLMVGNDEFSDIAGAVRAGMDTLYIHTEISPPLSGDSLATYTVADGDWKKAARILTGQNLQPLAKSTEI